MTGDVRGAVMLWLRESDRREIKPKGFFRNGGIHTTQLFPTYGDKSPLVVYDGFDGTVVPPLWIELGTELGKKLLSPYFQIRDHTFTEPIKGSQVVELTEVQMIGTRWYVQRRGLIDGKPKPPST
ncbi:MAG: hypothetical protein Q7R67_02715 [bacterium]|nr:hypothetical protein [bacterium]